MAKGCSTTSNKYEAAREQRLEENKKRFEVIITKMLRIFMLIEIKGFK